MELSNALPGPVASGCSPAQVRLAGGVQRPALGGKNRSLAGVHAPRLPAPHDSEQARRWERGVEDLAHDLRETLRRLQGRAAQASTAICDGRTLQSSPGSSGREGWEAQRQQAHGADTLGHLLALLVTPASERDRTQVAALCKAVQAVSKRRPRLPLVRPPGWASGGQGRVSMRGVRLEGQEGFRSAAEAGWSSGVLPEWLSPSSL